MIRRLFPIAAALLAFACSATTKPAPPQLTDAMYPWQLRSPAAFASDFVWQQRLTSTANGETRSLRVVLQKQSDRMVLVGLTPFGTKAFVLDQSGQDVHFEKFFDRSMPFPPRFMLIDIQRSYLPLGAVGQGETRTELDGEEIVQVFADGHLVERRFRRLDAQPPGTITVQYREFVAPGVPRHVHIDNRWFGYVLEVTTLEAKTLPATEPK